MLTRAAEHDEEVHAVDADVGVVLDAEINVLLDAEAEVSRHAEVVRPQLVFTHLPRSKVIGRLTTPHVYHHRYIGLYNA